MITTKSFQAHAEALFRSAGVVRDQVRAKLVGRGAHVVATSVALVGFGLAGVSAATTSDTTPADSGANPGLAVGDDARVAAAQRADRAERTATTDAASTQPAKKADWMSPMNGAETTSCWGPRWGTMHAGLDLAQPENAPIFAAGAGTVVAEGWLYTGYGISVVIDHGNGYLTHYAHQNKTNVQVGDKVAAGDLIGWEGSTGDSTGPHLHFEVHEGAMWNQVDPGPWMKERGVDLKC